MEPKTMALIGSMAAGSVIGAAGEVSAGITESNTLKYNADLAEQEGKNIKTASAIQASDVLREQRRLMARKIAVNGASGTGFGGSFAENFAYSAGKQAVDRSRIAKEGIQGQYSKKTEAASYKAAAKGAKSAGYIRGATTLLGGATQGMTVLRGPQGG